MIPFFKSLFKKHEQENVHEKIDSRQTGLHDSVKRGWFQQETDELFKGFTLKEKDSFLDVGAGSGMVCLFAAQRGCHISYTDIDENTVKSISDFLTTKGFPSHLGKVSDTVELPFSDENFDKIVSTEVLEHMEHPELGLTEMVRVGKPGAKYLLSVPGAEGEIAQKKYAPESYFKKPNHLHVFSKLDFIKLVEDSGLQVQTYTTSGFYWFIWMSLYWIEKKQNQETVEGATLDKVSPPYTDLQNMWSELWSKILVNPHSEEFRLFLDNTVPKNQIIIAVKPLG